MDTLRQIEGLIWVGNDPDAPKRLRIWAKQSVRSLGARNLQACEQSYRTAMITGCIDMEA